MSPRVLVVAPVLEIGGTEMHLLSVLPELRRRGLDVSVFVVARGGRLESQIVSQGVELSGPEGGRSRTLRSAVAAFELHRELRRLRPDILHCFLPEPYLIGSLAATGMKTTRVMSRRSLAVYQANRPMLARLEHKLHQYAKALLGNSDAVVNELIAECKDAGKVGLIPSGIAMPPAITAERRLAARPWFGIAPDTFVMAVSANFIPYKGHDDLFEALHRMAFTADRPWRLMLLGRDEEGNVERLRAKASALGFGPNVLWLVGRDDARSPLDVADIAILPSHQEGLSISLLEKMARGLPVIATRVGGNIDAVVDRESGLLVPVKDPPALSAAISELWNSPDLRDRLGRAARARVETHFSLDACVTRYMNFYNGLLAHQGGPIQALIDRAPALTAAPAVAHS